MMIERFGIVLSHWIMDERVAKIGKEHIEIGNKYFMTSKGFGDGRKVSSSIGTVSYSGERGSGRAIPAPL